MNSNITNQEYNSLNLEQHTGYYPYGLPFADSYAPTVNRRKYGAKELTPDLGLNAYDFEARTLTPAFPIFLQPDPLTESYYPLSPYLYCAGNPINYVDPTGCDWYMTKDNKIKWTDYMSQEEMDKNNISGIYLGQAYVEFIGSRKERLGKRNGVYGYIDGDGAVTAKVNHIGY